MFYFINFENLCGADSVTKTPGDGSSKDLWDSEIATSGNSEPNAEASDDGCTPSPKGISSLYYCSLLSVGVLVVDNYLVT